VGPNHLSKIHNWNNVGIAHKVLNVDIFCMEAVVLEFFTNIQNFKYKSTCTRRIW
jgi:hypothetical protein